MGKIYRCREFLGGLLAGIILNIFGLAAIETSPREIWKPEAETSNPTFQKTIGYWIISIVSYFITGILAVWL